jgi:hypothetical protein
MPMTLKKCKLAGVLDTVPAVFTSCLKEPAFMMEDTTFCFWCTAKDTVWQRGNNNETRTDGSSWLLDFYTFTPPDYVEWASGYHEKKVSLEAVEHVFAHELLTQAIVKALAPKCSLKDLTKDLKEIGYPS